MDGVFSPPAESVTSSEQQDRKPDYYQPGVTHTVYIPLVTVWHSPPPFGIEMGAITAHNVGEGRITVDRVCEHDGGSGNPGLGWGSKYYVENKPYLLDTAGEWWYDSATQRLYLWPPAPGDPGLQNIEISRRDNGFSLRNRSYIVLDGLTIEFLDGSAVYLANWETHKAYGDTVRNVTLRYANWGVYVEQSVRATSPPENVIDGFTLEDSEIAHMDSLAIRLIDWWENSAAADSFTRPGVLNTVIRNN